MKHLIFLFFCEWHAERLGGMSKRPITTRQKESIKKVSKLASLLVKGLGTQQEHLHPCQEHFLIQAPC